MAGSTYHLEALEIYLSEFCFFDCAHSISGCSCELTVMKTIRFFVAFMALAASVRSQDGGNPVPQQGAAPVATPRILGNIPDGTPPPPAPPKPAFVVPPSDILATTTHEQGGRTITIRKIKPIDLPAPPDSVTPAANIPNRVPGDGAASSGSSHPGARMLSLGATVYRFKDSPPRTLVQYRPQPEAEAITFWSSADFTLIAGIQGIVAADGLTYRLVMAWSTTDTTRGTAASASGGNGPVPPGMPDFADGPATFTIVGTPPADPAVLGPIQSLHDVYNSEYQRLKTAYEGRELARLQHEADLKANPPRPQNITIHVWDIPADQAAELKGGTQP